MAFAAFSSLFATPCVTPAQKHLESLQAGILQLTPFLGAAPTQPGDEADKQPQQVTRLENTAHVLSF